MKGLKIGVKQELFINGVKAEGHASPTENFKDDVITELGTNPGASGVAVLNPINRMKVYDDAGTLRETIDTLTKFDNTSQSPPNVVFRVSYVADASYKISKIELIYFDGSTDRVYFTYTLATAKPVEPNYGVRIDYKITITVSAVTSGTSINATYTDIHKVILWILINQRGNRFLNMYGLELYSDSSLIASPTVTAREGDTANNKAKLTCTYTPGADQTYNRVDLIRVDYVAGELTPTPGISLNLDTPDTLYEDVQYTFYFIVSI